MNILTVDFYKNNSDSRYIDKSLTSLAVNIPCVFKDDTSLLEPQIIISRDNFNVNCDYVKISDLNRYYYVRDIEFSQQKCYLHLAVDALMSFKTHILQCEAVAARSANQYNNYLDDNEMTRLQYSDIYLKKFPNSLSKNLSLVLVVGGA